MAKRSSSTGPCGIHKVESCTCGNLLDECPCSDSGSKIRVRMNPCKCKEPGPMRGAKKNRKLSTTKYGNVKKTWQDWECDQIAEASYSEKIRAHRHQVRQRKLGGRVIYDE